MALGNPAYTQTLVTAQASGAAVGNTTTPTSLLPAPAVYTLPANSMAYIGQKLRLRASGQISTTGTPTITFTIYLSGAAFCASQAITTGSGLSSVTWTLDLELTMRALGSGTSANAMFTGVAYGVAGATAVTQIPASSPAVSSGFSSVQANTLDLFATWGTANASNTLTLVQYELISPN